MRLRELLDRVEVTAIHGDPSVEIADVTHDSRAVRTGTLFCCVAGSSADGHDFAPAAAADGAAALLVERRVDVDLPQVEVPDVRAAMGRVAATFQHDPSSAMTVVGVTGTNGKTTVTWLLRSIFEAAGHTAAMIGTLTSAPGGPPTTPDSITLQRHLAELRDAGTTAVAMEVSSHALAQSRVDGTRFAAAVFTNLSRDHLDFHDSMEDYFAAKARLFEPERSERAVVNVDDPRGRLLLDAARIPTVGFSLDDVRDLRILPSGSEGTWRGRTMRVPLVGTFNVANALAAATVAVELGIDIDVALAGLEAAPQVPGRFELVDAGQPFTVVVDYAHTPDGLEQVLRSARAVTSGRVHVVFGAGGDKDRPKRPMMGEVAARLADVVVVTSDNPRSEDPEAIIDEIVAGMPVPPEVREADRRTAIERALAGASAGDIVVVAGKGHETTQTIADQVVPFDDREVVKDVLS